MRTLLAHPLRPLVLVLALCAACAAPGRAAVTVPSPIGKLSDYGAVFDRHDRTEVNASIERMSKLLRVDVYILASWENPLPSVDQLASAVFSAWNLSPRRAILAVFLRTGLDWSASVVASSAVRTELGAIDQRLEARMADLVAHRRVKEAARALFDELEGLPAAQKTSAALARQGTGSSKAVPTAALVGGIAAAVLALAVLIRWRVCPRCARILRVQRSRFRSAGTRRVYSCRRCGYRRGG